MHCAGSGWRGVGTILFAPPHVAGDVPAVALQLAVLLLLALLVIAMSRALHVARERAEVQAREAALLARELAARRRFLRQVLR